MTASHVRIRARLKDPATTSGQPTLSVRLHIDEHWHVNANPASLDFLIPTTVAAKADDRPLTLQTTYPPGLKSDIRLGDTVIKVYENNTTIRSQLSPAAAAAATSAGGMQVSVTAQACNDKGICLPPSVMKTRVADNKE